MSLFLYLLYLQVYVLLNINDAKSLFLARKKKSTFRKGMLFVSTNKSNGRANQTSRKLDVKRTPHL